MEGGYERVQEEMQGECQGEFGGGVGEDEWKGIVHSRWRENDGEGGAWGNVYTGYEIMLIREAYKQCLRR